MTNLFCEPSLSSFRPIPSSILVSLSPFILYYYIQIFYSFLFHFFSSFSHSFVFSCTSSTWAFKRKKNPVRLGPARNYRNGTSNWYAAHPDATKLNGLNRYMSAPTLEVLNLGAFIKCQLVPTHTHTEASTHTHTSICPFSSFSASTVSLDTSRKQATKTSALPSNSR